MAWPRMPSLYLVIACLCLVEQATGKGFLNVEPHAESGASSEDLEFALEHVLGCGGAVSDARLSEIERALTPVWMVLPKSSQGKVGWRSMRYLAHRFFMQQSSLLVKGFEPMRRLNASERGLADIMEDRLPSLGGLAEESEDRYALQDAVLLVATLEQLIFDAESSLLEQAYYRSGSRMFATSGQSSISFDRLAEVLETYMILWMMGAEHESVGILLGNQSLLHAEFPHWRALKEFVRGQIRSMDFARHREPVEHRRSLLQEGYSFQDAHKVVGDITKSFAPFWESECQAIKSGLVELDRSGTGRVRLADFYGASIDGEWRFGESETYLREMGVLDETSTMRGKQVIIPNYVQAASNCIVSTKNYLVCCHNACEDIMGEIESAIAAPLATPEQVLEVVGNLTAPSGDEDLPVKITQATKEQLMLVARHHDGMVPIHGRLFAQWLHYVFPRDCPFPHKVGSVKSQTPSEFGVEALASTSEMKVHAEPEGVRVDQAPMPIVEEDYRATQWSPEEEFIVDYKIHAPWERSSQWPVGIILLVAAAVVLHVWSFGGKWRGGKACSSLGADLPFSSSMMKAHMV